MRAFELFPHRHVQRFRRDAGRLAGVGMTIIALVIGECTPITATVRRPRTATPYMVAGLPLPITATASLGRLAAGAIGQWPLRFEVCDKGGPGDFWRERAIVIFTSQRPKRRSLGRRLPARGGLVAARIWDYHGMRDRLMRTSSFLDRAATERLHARAARRPMNRLPPACVCS